MVVRQGFYCTGRMEWLEKNVRRAATLRRVPAILNGGGGTDEKTGGEDGGGTVEYVAICVRSDNMDKIRNK